MKPRCAGRTRQLEFAILCASRYRNGPSLSSETTTPSARPMVANRVRDRPGGRTRTMKPHVRDGSDAFRAPDEPIAPMSRERRAGSSHGEPSSGETALESAAATRTQCGGESDAGEGAPVTAILLTVNQKRETLRCLESLEAVTEPSPSIIVWDNGSTDGTADEVRERFPNVLVHRHPRNLGAAAGRNEAARLAIERFSPPLLLFLDNDVVVTPEFLSDLCSPFAEGLDRVAQTSAKIRFLEEPRRLNDAGGSTINYWLARTTPVGYEEIDDGQFDRRTECIPPTGCMLVRTDVFLDVGGFDTRFDPYGMEDLDFSMRVRAAGYRALYVPEAVVYHEVSRPSGYGLSSLAYSGRKLANWLLFVRKHASPGQALAFFLLGVPAALLRSCVRAATGVLRPDA